MKLSISNIAWSKEYDEEIYSFLSKSGFEGLEIAPTRFFPDNPYERIETASVLAKEIKDKYNLAISSMQSIWFGRNERMFGTTQERLILLDYTKKAIDFAVEIGCNNIVFGSPKNRIISEEQHYQIAVDFFRELAKYATLKSTTIALEPNPTIYGTNFINHTNEAFDIVKEVNEPNFKVNLDIGTVIQNGESLPEICQNIHLINHIHISEPNLVEIQERQLHRDLARLLNEKKYDKFVSIEMKNLNSIELVKTVVNYIGEVFSY